MEIKFESNKIFPTDKDVNIHAAIFLKKNHTVIININVFNSFYCFVLIKSAFFNFFVIKFMFFPLILIHYKKTKKKQN